VLFYAGCNEKVISPKPSKKTVVHMCLVVFKKNAKMFTLILKNDVIEPKARSPCYFNNQ